MAAETTTQIIRKSSDGRYAVQVRTTTTNRRLVAIGGAAYDETTTKTYYHTTRQRALAFAERLIENQGAKINGTTLELDRR